MRISISGKNMDTGEALKKHVEDNINISVGKYFKDAMDAKVIFSKHGHFHVCEIIVDEGVRGAVPVTAKDEELEVYAAFNTALARVEKQLRRTKRKMKSRSNKTSLSELSIRAASA